MFEDDNYLNKVIAAQQKAKQQEDEEPVDTLMLRKQGLQRVLDNSTSNPFSNRPSPLNPDRVPLEQSEQEEPSLFQRVSDAYKTQVQKGNVGLDSPKSPMENAIKPLNVSQVQSPNSFEDPYGNELNDASLKAAQEEQKRKNILAGLFKAGETIGSGIARSKEKPTYEASKMLEEQGATEIKNIQTRREGKDKELSRQKLLRDMDDDKKVTDPNSDVSKFVVSEYQRLFPNAKLPPNVSAKQLKEMGINIGTLAGYEESNKTRKEIAEENRLARQEARADRLSERKEREDVRLEEKRRLSDKQVADITTFDNATDTLKEIMSEKSKFDTGPLAGRAHTVASWVGMEDSDKAAFKSKVGDQLAQYIKSISGAAVSDNERAALLKNLPNLNDNDETFKKKAQATLERLERNKKNTVGNIGKQGKNVKEFLPKEQSVMVRVKAPDGSIKLIPSNKVQDAVDAGGERLD